MKDPVFPEWQGRDLDGILGACLDLLEDTRFPTTRRWKEAGGRIVGHFQVYFPEEIAHAAGLLPFKVRGAPIQASQADSRFGSYLCSIVKSSLELALSKRVELDLFVRDQPLHEPHLQRTSRRNHVSAEEDLGRGAP